MPFDIDSFMRDWRAVRDRDGSKIVQAELDLVRSAIEGRYVPKPAPTGSPAAHAGDPPWLSEARKHIGAREIVGPKHNPWIAGMWKILGASWFTDDETPWCGQFVAGCMHAVGLPYPGKGQFARAKAWLDWGKPSLPVLGAVVVFGREGGGHVGFLVGESLTSWYVLGGNQLNAVNIMPFDKAARKPLGFRWPASLPAGETRPPTMSGGVQSTNEQ